MRLLEVLNRIPGLTIVQKYTYSTQVRGDYNFQKRVRDAGYTTRVRMPRMDRIMGQLQVALTLDVIQTLPDVDKILICASNSDYSPIVDYAKDKIVFLGVKISRELKAKCPCIELSANEFAETANQLELLSDVSINVSECQCGHADTAIGA